MSTIENSKNIGTEVNSVDIINNLKKQVTEFIRGVGYDTKTGTLFTDALFNSLYGGVDNMGIITSTKGQLVVNCNRKTVGGGNRKTVGGEIISENSHLFLNNENSKIVASVPSTFVNERNFRTFSKSIDDFYDSVSSDALLTKMRQSDTNEPMNETEIGELMKSELENIALNLNIDCYIPINQLSHEKVMLNNMKDKDEYSTFIKIDGNVDIRFNITEPAAFDVTFNTVDKNHKIYNSFLITINDLILYIQAMFKTKTENILNGEVDSKLYNEMNKCYYLCEKYINIIYKVNEVDDESLANSIELLNKTYKEYFSYVNDKQSELASSQDAEEEETEVGEEELAAMMDLIDAEELATGEKELKEKYPNLTTPPPSPLLRDATTASRDDNVFILNHLLPLVPGNTKLLSYDKTILPEMTKIFNEKTNTTGLKFTMLNIFDVVEETDIVIVNILTEIMDKFEKISINDVKNNQKKAFATKKQDQENDVMAYNTVVSDKKRELGFAVSDAINRIRTKMTGLEELVAHTNAAQTASNNDRIEKNGKLVLLIIAIALAWGVWKYISSWDQDAYTIFDTTNTPKESGWVQSTVDGAKSSVNYATNKGAAVGIGAAGAAGAYFGSTYIASAIATLIAVFGSLMATSVPAWIGGFASTVQRTDIDQDLQKKLIDAQLQIAELNDISLADLGQTGRKLLKNEERVEAYGTLGEETDEFLEKIRRIDNQVGGKRVTKKARKRKTKRKKQKKKNTARTRGGAFKKLSMAEIKNRIGCFMVEILKNTKPLNKQSIDKLVKELTMPLLYHMRDNFDEIKKNYMLGMTAMRIIFPSTLLSIE